MGLFEVDRDGLRKQALEHGKGKLIGELIQNAFDEDGVTTVHISLHTEAGKASLMISDDAPEGFKDLSHAYTLFTESYKRSNPEKRGQFNLGEKFFISICDIVTIKSTKGTVLFAKNRTVTQTHTEKGTILTAIFKCNKEEKKEIEEYIFSILVPPHIVLTYNESTIHSRIPIKTFPARLETKISNEEGVMVPTQRIADVEVYDVLPGETAKIYELGLPVVDTGDKYHVNVKQRVPLNKDRDNVTPSFLRKLRTEVANAMVDYLTEQDVNKIWVREASSNPNISAAAIKKVMDLRFGEKRASFDPTDPEANNAWVAQGGTLVHGRNLNADEWGNVRKHGLIESTSRLCPTAKPYSSDPNSNPVNVIAESQWTEDMKKVVDYSKEIAKNLISREVSVRIVNTTNNFVAAYGNGVLDFNLMRLGHKWFNQINESTDSLLIHELSHERSSNHLSHEYHEEICRLGAKLVKFSLDRRDEMIKYKYGKTKETG